jgi:hypothetical protein
MQLDAAATAVRLEQEFLEVARFLDEAEIAYAVLKGVATAHMDYEDPSHRQFGDVDVLVAPTDLDTALRILAGRGWVQSYPLPPHHDRFTHAITLRGSGLLELDLHQRIGHRALGILLPTTQLLDDRVRFGLAGRDLFALSPADRLIHASIHTISSRASYRRLSSVADVLILSTALESAAASVLARAESWRVRRLIEAAVALSFQMAQLSIPAQWTTAMESPIRQRDRLVERAYLGQRRRAAFEELAYLRLLRSWKDRWLYIGGYFLADDSSAHQPMARSLISNTRYLWSRLSERSY